MPVWARQIAIATGVCWTFVGLFTAFLLWTSDNSFAGSMSRAALYTGVIVLIAGAGSIPGGASVNHGLGFSSKPMINPRTPDESESGLTLLGLALVLTPELVLVSFLLGR
jgi:hypothetical protein